MSAEIASLVGGFIYVIGYDVLLMRRTIRWCADWLGNVPQVVIGLLGGLVSALYCVHTYMTLDWHYTVWRWLVEWVPFPPTIGFIFACMQVPGPPMRESHATVPAVAMAGGAYAPSTPSRYNRFVGWLQVPWHRIMFRGALMVICGAVVLVVRGDLRAVRGMVLIAVYAALHVFAAVINPEGPED